MLKGLSFLALRALPLLLLSAPAWAGSTLAIDSQTGDSIGDGQDATYTDAQGNFAVANLPNNAIKITYQQTNPSLTWVLEFAPPKGATLSTGNYDFAQLYPFAAPLQPGLSVSGTTGLCDTSITGRMVVRAITTDGSGNVTSFAADFQQTCGSDSAGMTGEIRYNSSIPLAVDEPTADAGVKQLVQQGASVQLDGALSDSGNGNITAYTWTQLSGPSITFSDPNAVAPTFTTPSVSLGGADIVLQLEVDNSLALSSTSTVTVHVANPADPLTLFTVTGDAGWLMPAGGTLTFNNFQALFTPASLNTNQGIGVNIQAYNNTWGVKFAAPTGGTLQIGTYDDAQAYGDRAVSQPGIDLAANSDGCDAESGRFTILDLQKDGSGNVISFAADFQQVCGSLPPKIVGMIRYNSTVPLDAPVADAIPVPAMLQGETVTLQGSSWPTGTDGDDITSYLWTQISGTTVTLSDPNAADPTFTAPTEAAAGGEDLVFQLTVTNSLGISSSTEVTVHIANPADQMTLLHVETHGGTTVSDPYLLTVTSAQTNFTVRVSSLVDATQGLQISTSDFLFPWSLNLTWPFHIPETPASPGTYLVPVWLPIFGQVGVTGPSGFTCIGGTISARFAVFDLQLGTNDVVNSAAVDFDQYCSSSTATLHGAFRYNSSVPVDMPVSDPGAKQNVVQGTTVDLSGQTSFTGADDESIGSYQWSQLSGTTVTLSDATAVSPSFIAPTESPGGEDLLFQLTVTNSNGLKNSSDVTVHVANPGDPITVMQLTSDAGDPVGNGRSLSFSPLNAMFGVGRGPTFADLGDVNGIEISAAVQSEFLSDDYWKLDISAPFGQIMQVGSYDLATGYSDTEILGLPGMSAYYQTSSGDSACGFNQPQSGYFDVLDIQRDQNNTITSLAVDFLQQCSGATGALHGKIRYNSTVPLDQPYADTGPDQTVQVGQTVTLGGMGSVAGPNGSTITSVQWTQTSGPTVNLSDPTSADPTFTAPTVTAGTDLTFTVTITNSDGGTSTRTVTIHLDGLNDPKTVMYLVGAAGEPITQGQTVTLDALNALFNTSERSGGAGAPANQVTVNADQGVLAGANEDLTWTLQVQAANNQSLQSGHVYQNLDGSLSGPLFGVSGAGRCDEPRGQFKIRDLQLAKDGSVASFAADVVQTCFDSPPTLHAWIRYNSKVPLGTPIAVVAPGQNTYTGFMVNLDGSQSFDAAGPMTYQWTQIKAAGDPSVTLTGANTATPSFAAPNVPLGGRNLVFQLTVTNGAGLTDSEPVTVHVGNEDDPKMAFYYQSDADDPDGQGMTALVVPDQASFELTNPYPGGGDFTVYPTGLTAYNQTWELGFFATNGETAIHTGVYPLGAADDYPIMIATDGTCNQTGGEFLVRDVGLDKFGRITSLGVDLVRHCQGATGDLRAAFRYNSTTPIRVTQPTAYAGPDQIVSTPGQVTLDGSDSFIAWSGAVSYQWTQLSGPTVQLLNRTKSIASLALPESAMSTKGTALVLQLKVTNSLGQSSTSQVTITGKQQFTGLLSFQSDAGDIIGQGQTASFSLQDGALSVRKDANNSLQANMASNGYWMLDFAAKNKQALKIGTYSGAVLYRLMGTPVPGLSVSASGHRCNSVSGDFTVRDVQYQGGTISSLAVDFDQFCDGSSAGLHGKLRYHSSIP